MKEVKFTTEVEYKDQRITVLVEATFHPGYREQEYPGAHVWNHASSMEIDEVIIEGTDTDILNELSEAKLKWIQCGAFDVLAGDQPRSEFTDEDEMESRDAARFEDMAYGPPDYD